MAFLESGNHTTVTEFILLGLTDDPVLKVIFFTIILCIYLVIVSGNLSTILLIRVSTQLHHPMYFFLSHLASIDIGTSSSVTPNILINFLVERYTISYIGCGIQFGSAAFFGSAECFLLGTMAYDRFLAICNPVLYSTKMSAQVCLHLLAGSYIGSFLNASLITGYVFSFLFCGPNTVNHFYCDLAPLMALSCSDVSGVVISLSAGSVTITTLFIIAIAYFYILITILKMRSTEGHQKAFSICTSHLTAVTLYYGTVEFIYVMPNSRYSTVQNKVMSMFYMVVVPMLNPLIYSLRSNEIKCALKRQFSKKPFS
ncbi:olfactory receptor 5P76-like [Arvicanthis niloticus]|uniref:olfactory receptor 5P76-like n=1 Tax=Arvicanthis niloticus TaxID=61156 RepID=UPI001486729B|nr:olfactory receptor 502-like [Arvicanthis niloticus]